MNYSDPSTNENGSTDSINQVVTRPEDGSCQPHVSTETLEITTNQNRVLLSNGNHDSIDTNLLDQKESNDKNDQDELIQAMDQLNLFTTAVDASIDTISSSQSSPLHPNESVHLEIHLSSLTCCDPLDDDYDIPTLKTVARWIRDGQCKKILILSGAGVSCSAGIPDFRTPGTGLYDNLQRYNLPYPEAVFDLAYYKRNPKPFVSLAAELWPGMRHSPTLTHSFLSLLDQKGLLLRNYTQNIDGLEILAGVSEEKIVECHGHFRTASCIQCGAAFDGEKCKTSIVVDRSAPRCVRSKCNGWVKPDIVFFGESLPPRFGKLLHKDLKNTDLLIVMGTSLMVAPVSLIPEMLDEKCPRVLLNREVVGDFELPLSYSSWNRRDVIEQGDCDASVMKLCEFLGWEKELLEKHASVQLLQQGEPRS